MTSGIIHNLAWAASTIADHADPAARFGMAVGFLCDLALDSDFDGIWIAIERGVEDYNHLSDEEDMIRGMAVPRVRDQAGKIVALQVEDTTWADHTYVLLAREIALLKNREARIVALEAAAIRLIQNGADQLEDLLASLSNVRREDLGLQALGIPLAGQARSQIVWKVVAADQGPSS